MTERKHSHQINQIFKSDDDSIQKLAKKKYNSASDMDVVNIQEDLM